MIMSDGHVNARILKGVVNNILKVLKLCLDILTVIYLPEY
jgi:hypothetical protein